MPIRTLTNNNFKIDGHDKMTGAALMRAAKKAKEVAHSVMDDISDFLEHYGVKGMRWGVRRKRGSDGRVIKGDAKTKPKPKQTKASKDKAHVERVKSTKTTDAMSNQEMNDVLNRMNLEQRWAKAHPGRIKRAQIAVSSVLAVGATLNAAVAFTKSPVGKIVTEVVAKKLGVETDNARKTKEEAKVAVTRTRNKRNEQTRKAQEALDFIDREWAKRNK